MNSTKSKKRRNVPHSTRPELSGVCHVVLRIRRGLPWLRTPRTYRVLERAFRQGKEKSGFAVVQFSVQRDHLHLLVETAGKQPLARGMQGLAIRIAKALNRYWRRRIGSVFAERYFARVLEGYREMRRALAYVVNNARKHRVWFSSTQPDPFSSGRWCYSLIGGRDPIRRPFRAPPVARSRLLAIYYCHIAVDFVPGQPPPFFGELAELLA